MTQRKRRTRPADYRWQDLDPAFASESRRYPEPIPSRELILSELRDADRALSAHGLAQRLGVHKDVQIRALESRLQAMSRDGQLRRSGRNTYAPAADLGLLEGRVTAHRDGYGWFVPDTGPPDVHLDAGQMAGVMHGDRVRIRVTSDDGRGRRSGAVVEVIERGTRELAGRIEDAGDVAVVIPENPRFRQRILIPSGQRGSARHGDLVIVELTQPPTRTANAIGRVKRVVETRNAAELAAELAIVTHGLPHAWPDAVEREARGWGDEVRPSEIAGRADLRELAFVTIDGEDARDFDDAVYCEPAARGWRLWVAIADVSTYVPIGSALDIEAQERATSVYFPDRVLPMLPEALSNELCSLKPEVDRLALVCEMHVDAHGAVNRPRFQAAVIRSQARLTYTKVAAILLAKDPALSSEYAALVPHLEHLHRLYLGLRIARERRGALDFDAPEIKVRLTEEGSVGALEVHARNDAHRLIEECMIAANIEAARFLEKHGLPTLYRVHGEPEERRVTELQRMLRALGVGVRFPATIGTRELKQVSALIAGRPDVAFIESLLIRSLPQAVYQPANIGHFGLGLKEYAHFTSPIRRYPDLLVHRAIHHAIRTQRRAAFTYTKTDMERLGSECSTKERRADEAARDVMAYLKCDYMRAHVGDEFDAVVTGVVEFGLFVQLDNLQVDGLVHVSALHGDFFEFDARHCAWTGRRTRRSYRLGMHVTVRLTRVDLRERQLDFELATEPHAAAVRGARKTRSLRRKRRTS
jgi:ribonuclease R